MNLPVTVTGGNAELAYTGASILTPALAGLGALVLGGGLLIASRRRSPRYPQREPETALLLRSGGQGARARFTGDLAEPGER